MFNLWYINACHVDTGQLAHGVDSDNDMMVKFPRLVKFFQSKQLSRIACGGLHSVAVTSEGEVFTWGKLPCKECSTWWLARLISSPMLLQ